MPRLATWLAALVLLTACRGERESPPSGEATPPATGPATAAPPAAAAPASGALDCTRAAPRAVIDAAMPGATIAPAAGVTAESVECRLEVAGPPPAVHRIRLSCHPGVKGQRAAAIAAVTSGMAGARELSVGAGGVAYLDGDAATALAWDDDTDCSVSVHLVGSLEAAEVLVAALLAHYTPATVR